MDVIDVIDMYDSHDMNKSYHQQVRQTTVVPPHNINHLLFLSYNFILLLLLLIYTSHLRRQMEGSYWMNHNNIAFYVAEYLI